MEPYGSGGDYSVRFIRHGDAVAFMDKVESNFGEGSNDPFGREVWDGI
jgi:hypothetical protein